jgi:hypothetical protein
MWENARIWIAIVLLADAGIGLFFSNRLQPRLRRVNVVRIALVEAAAALVIVVIHFTLK